MVFIQQVFFLWIKFTNQYYRKYILTIGVKRSILSVSKPNYRIHKIVEKGEQKWEIYWAYPKHRNWQEVHHSLCIISCRWLRIG